MSEVFPHVEQGEDPEGTPAPPGACPLCAYALLTAEGSALIEYRLVSVDPGLTKSDPVREGDLILCTGCTSLLVMAERGMLAIPTRRSFALLLPTHRQRILKLCQQLEQQRLPASVCPPGTRYVASRGDHCVAGLRLGTGQMLTSDPCNTLEEAAALLERVHLAEIELDYKQQPEGWLVRGRLCAFPNRHLVLGMWGPVPTQESARTIGRTEAVERANAMGFALVGFKAVGQAN